MLIFLNDHELPDDYSYYLFGRFSRLLSLLPTFGLLLALASSGLITSARRWREMMPLYLGGAGYLVSVIVFFKFARFRLPFMPILIVFASLGAISLARAAASRRWRRLALHAGVAAAVLVGAHADLPWGREAPFQDQLHLAAAYRHEGRETEAERILRETIVQGHEALEVLAGGADPAAGRRIPILRRLLKEAHTELAGILQGRSQSDEAIGELTKAVALDPADAAAVWRLGRAYEIEGDLLAAIKVYERGLVTAPDSFSLRFGHAATLLRTGDVEGAWRQLREARRRSPEIRGARLANWHYAMGLTLHAIPGHRDEALGHLESGLDLNPSHPQADRARRLLKGRAEGRG